MSIGLSLYERLPLVELSALSAAGLDRPLAHDAELVVASLAGEGTVYGALQREVDAPPAPGERWARLSGGHAVRAGDGTLYVGLALSRPDALLACEAPRLLNRHVRPILKALGRSGALAHYFDRDWISVRHRPVAALGFAHDAGSRRAVVEAFVALARPFAVDEACATYLGKRPATVAEAAGRSLDAGALADAIAAAFGEATGHALVPHDPGRGAPRAAPAGPAWVGRAPEAIGDVVAGTDEAGALRVGGAWMASRDAIAGLEADLAASGDDDGDARAIDARLSAPGVVTFGIKSLASVLAAVREARAAQRKPA